MHTRAVLHVLQLNTFRVSLQKWIREHKEDYRGDRIEDFQDKYLQKVFAGEKYFTGAENTSRFSHKSICQNKIFHCSEDGLGAILREMFVIGVEAESGILRWGIRILCVNKVSDFPLKILLDTRKLFEFSNKCSFRMCRGESRTRSTTSSRRTRTWSGRTGRGERDDIIFFKKINFFPAICGKCVGGGQHPSIC